MTLPIAKVVSGATTTNVVAAQMNLIPSVPTQGGNVVSPPRFRRPNNLWVRRTQLEPGSPAIASGLPGSTAFVPGDDIDGDPRPSGPVDMGWNQLGAP
jgi:hypothetical protein